MNQNFMHNQKMAHEHHWHGLEAFGLDLVFAASGRGNALPGSSWRGLMGSALSAAVCVRSVPACGACPSTGACAYPGLFKPLAEDALPPLWLHGWQRLADGAHWRVAIRWLGSARHAAVGEWLHALAVPSHKRRFGDAPAVLLRADEPKKGSRLWQPGETFTATPRALPLVSYDPPPARVRIDFLTPLVSKHAGDPLFGPLRTRLQRLIRQYGDGTALPALTKPWSSQVVRHKQLHVPLGGGRLLHARELTLELTDIDPSAWAMLQAGRELHAGGQAALGCGAYRLIHSTPSPAKPATVTV